MPYARHAGISVYYESYGEGHPFILIHANPFDHRLWMYQIARYSQAFRVLALDLRGYGLSDKPETRFTLGAMAADVLAICEQEGIERAIFAGISVGSGIAMLIGLDRPELVEALILVGGSAYGVPDPNKQISAFSGPDFASYYQEVLEELVAPGFLEREQGRWVRALFTAGQPALSGRCIAEIYRARSECDMRARLPNLRPPTLVINGEHDVSLEGGTETAQHVPGAKHVVIPGTGHVCNIEDPAAFDEAVLSFLSEVGLYPPRKRGL
jgi:3-oxoadipate enol-lactonase